MTTEERTERTRHDARLETLERDVSLIAAGEAANAQRITDTRVALEQQIGDRIQVLEIKNNHRFDALSAEHTQHKALLEDLQRHVRVIAEGHLANAQSIKDTKAELEQQIKQVDHRLMVLDIKVHEQLKGLEARFDAKLDALESRFDAKLDAKLGALESRFDAKLDVKLGALESRIDSKFDAFGKELSRIVAHLGLEGAPRPTKHL